MVPDWTRTAEIRAHSLHINSGATCAFYFSAFFVFVNSFETKTYFMDPKFMNNFQQVSR